MHTKRETEKISGFSILQILLHNFIIGTRTSAVNIYQHAGISHPIYSTLARGIGGYITKHA